MWIWVVDVKQICVAIRRMRYYAYPRSAQQHRRRRHVDRHQDDLLLQGQQLLEVWQPGARQRWVSLLYYVFCPSTKAWHEHLFIFSLWPMIPELRCRTDSGLDPGKKCTFPFTYLGTKSWAPSTTHARCLTVMVSGRGAPRKWMPRANTSVANGAFVNLSVSILSKVGWAMRGCLLFSFRCWYHLLLVSGV